MKKNNIDNNIKKIKTSYSFLWPFLLLTATLFMGIGYAAVNSVTAEVDGVAMARVREGVFIESVKYSDSFNVDMDQTKINSTSDTMLASSLKFLDDNSNSYMVYDVTIHNSAMNNYIFSGALYDELFYTDNNGLYNSSIIFELIGINNGDVLGSGESKTFQIKFKYSDSNRSQNVLNSYINFSFKKIFSITYANIYKGNYPTYISEGESLIIDMSLDKFDSVIIQIDGKEITDYTYENYILTIPNVFGDVNIEGAIGTPKSYFEFDKETGTITKFTDSSYSGDVVIPDTIDGVKITTIADGAFSYCSNITSVVIPEGVTTIGESAFRDCYSVTRYVIPNTVITIGDNAFREGQSLVEIIVPDSVEVIGTWAFAGCANLETVTLGKGVQSIGEATFSYDPKLQTIYIVPGSTLIIPEDRWGASSSVNIIKQ